MRLASGRCIDAANGDGIGDPNGITAKLDYLKALGIDVIWLSPHFDSPNADNGYDIRDYRKVMAEFGTMDDFDRMLAGIQARGMKLLRLLTSWRKRGTRLDSRSVWI